MATTTTEEIIHSALLNHATATFRDFGEGLANRADINETVLGDGEFLAIYNDKLNKIEGTGRLGPKGWAKLANACPPVWQRYFEGIPASGLDLTTDDGLARFCEVAHTLSFHLSEAQRLANLEAFYAAVAEALDDEEDDEEEEDDS